jgi:ATP-dependent protease ClpP protease subunit
VGKLIDLNDLKKRAVIIGDEITEKVINKTIQDIYVKIMSDEKEIIILFPKSLGGSPIIGSRLISTMELLKSMDIVFTGLVIDECSSACADIFFFCNNRFAVNPGARFLMHPGQVNTSVSIIPRTDSSTMDDEGINDEYENIMIKEKHAFVKNMKKRIIYDKMLHRCEIGSKIFELIKENRTFFASELAEKGFLEILVK